VKRRDLEVGLEVATKRGYRAVVVATEPWDESREYMGRFGTAHTGRFFPVSDGPGRGYSPNKSGVAVATQNGRTGEWAPEVMMLGQLDKPWAEAVAEEVEQARRRAIASQAASDREAARVAFSRVPEVLHPQPVMRGGMQHYSSTEVTVNLGVLLEYLEGRRAL
jgi:hypothetical protein